MVAKDSVSPELMCQPYFGPMRDGTFSALRNPIERRASLQR